MWFLPSFSLPILHRRIRYGCVRRCRQNKVWRAEIKFARAAGHARRVSQARRLKNKLYLHIYAYSQLTYAKTGKTLYF
jgi:hypothetical protein